MKINLLKTILSTSCLSFIVCNAPAMADVEILGNSPRHISHKRQQALVGMSESNTLAIEACKHISNSRYAAARENAEKLAKEFGETKGAQKILDIQEAIFSKQAGKYNTKVAFAPTTQPWIEILAVKDRPTAGTSYERTQRKPHKGPLKRTGRDEKEVTARVGFLSALNREESLKKETARKKPRAKRVQELQQEVETFYTESGEAGNAKALTNLALFLQQKGDIERAEQLFRKAANKRGTLALNNLGEFLEAQRMLEDAKEAYETSASNGCMQARYNLAMFHLNNGNHKKAKELFQKLSKSKKLASTVRDGKVYYQLPDSEADFDPALIEMAASVDYNLAALIIREKGSLTHAATKLLNKVANGNNLLSGKAHYKLFKELRTTHSSEAYHHVREAAKEGLAHAQLDYGRLLAKKGKATQAMLQLQRAALKGDFRAAREMVPLLEQMKKSFEVATAVTTA